jgi:ADP-heptose:LPS heptosyltransferase
MGILKRSLKKNAPIKDLSLRGFYTKKDQILVLRQSGGVGDILMHRMMFEDFKKMYPACKITFACPQKYHPILKDHPFIDGLVCSREVKTSDFLISYNTSNACGRYEIEMAPFSGKHRSDIWANHCGVELTEHNMHLELSEELKQYGHDKLAEVRDDDKPSVVFCPISAMINKNLTGEQVTETVEGLREMGLFVYSCHLVDIPEFTKTKVPTISGCSLLQWMGVINAADYVLTVDTATFHLAGGLKKPLTGVFAWTDGKVYGKYYDFVLVQKHRDYTPGWLCGPCYCWPDCPKIDRKQYRKPCITELTSQMILKGAEEMLEKWPLKTLIN